MQAKLEVIIKWLKDSGLAVNESKTELCLFHRKDHHPITLFLSGQEITSKNEINVLGVTFDSKLQWSLQLEKNKKSKIHAAHNRSD